MGTLSTWAVAQVSPIVGAMNWHWFAVPGAPHPSFGGAGVPGSHCSPVSMTPLPHDAPESVAVSVKAPLVPGCPLTMT